MSINMQLQELGITKSDVQDILNQAAHNIQIPRLIFLGAAYLYTFDLDDFEIVRKHNILGRYNINANIEWHRCLERWLNDQTVTLADKAFSPIAISRNFYRITNEGMEMIAAAIIGSGSVLPFQFRSLGDGDVAGDTPNPNTRVLSHEVDRIDVLNDPDGGSLSQNGSTVYSIGNHNKDIPTPDNEEFTECGMHDSEDPNTDKLLDYSIFEDPIPHVQSADAPGSTTVIYMCSS